MRRVIPGPAGGGRMVDAQQTACTSGQLADEGRDRIRSCNRLPDPLENKASWKKAKLLVGDQSLTTQISSMRPFKTIPKLLVYVEAVKKGGGGGSLGAHLMLRDPTGVTSAVCTPSVLEEEPELAAGTTLLLENVSIFAPPGCPSCLSITPDNILSIYSPPPPTGLFPIHPQGASNPKPYPAGTRPMMANNPTHPPSNAVLEANRSAAKAPAPARHTYSQGSGVVVRVLGDLLMVDNDDVISAEPQLLGGKAMQLPGASNRAAQMEQRQGILGAAACGRRQISQNKNDNRLKRLISQVDIDLDDGPMIAANKETMRGGSNEAPEKDLQPMNNHQGFKKRREGENRIPDLGAISSSQMRGSVELLSSCQQD